MVISSSPTSSKRHKSDQHNIEQGRNHKHHRSTQSLSSSFSSSSLVLDLTTSSQCNNIHPTTTTFNTISIMASSQDISATVVSDVECLNSENVSRIKEYHNEDILNDTNTTTQILSETSTDHQTNSADTTTTICSQDTVATSTLENTSGSKRNRSISNGSMLRSNKKDECDRKQHDLVDIVFKPDPTTCQSDMSPDVYLHSLLECILGYKPTIRPSLQLFYPPSSSNDEDNNNNNQNENNNESEPFFAPISEEDLANYDIDIVTATRNNDLPSLQTAFYSEGKQLSCCNRFGESLLHMACRRGFTSIVQFLIQDANVPIRISDDCGRTPLHDTLWHRECQFEILDELLRRDPVMLLACDKHGYTPFAYARREHWGVWRQFLWDRKEIIQSVLDKNVVGLLFRSEGDGNGNGEDDKRIVPCDDSADQ